MKEPQNDPWKDFCKLLFFFVNLWVPKGSQRKKPPEPEQKDHWFIFTITLLELKEN